MDYSANRGSSVANALQATCSSHLAKHDWLIFVTLFTFRVLKKYDWRITTTQSRNGQSIVYLAFLVIINRTEGKIIVHRATLVASVLGAVRL